MTETHYKDNSDAVIELLRFVQNLDIDDARTFMRLYVKAINDSVMMTGKGHYLNLATIISEIAEIDDRFKES